MNEKYMYHIYFVYRLCMHVYMYTYTHTVEKPQYENNL